MCEVFDDIWEKEPYGCDLVNYKMSTEGYQCLPYDDVNAHIIIIHCNSEYHYTVVID